MTLTEIKEAAEKQPELRKEILSSFKDEFVKGAEAEGMVVRTKDEDQKYLDNHVKTVVDTKVSEALKPKLDEEFSKTMSKIDEEIRSITGIEKKSGEKTTAYAKRAIEEKQLKGGDPVTKERVKELEDLLRQKESEFDTKMKEKEESLFSQSIDYQVNAVLDKANIAMLPHLKSEEEKQSYVNTQKALIKQGFLSSFKPKKDTDGNIVFYDGDKPQMSTKDGKPKSAGDLISEKFAHYFMPSGPIKSGTGHEGGGGGGATFKSTEDVHKYLEGQKIEAGTEKYIKEYSRIVTENALDS